MDNKQDVWNEVKQYYYEKYGTAPELVDIAAVFDILKMCASGSSNKSIANFLNLSEVEVSELVDAYLNFNGWREDLSFSPLRLYKDLNYPDESIFVDEVILKYGYKWNMDLHRMYESARLAERFERLIDEKWI